MAKKISILGSTGSIGTQTLDVVREIGGIEVKAVLVLVGKECEQPVGECDGLREIIHFPGGFIQCQQGQRVKSIVL